MIMKFEKRQKWGKDIYYPACDNSKILALMLRKQSIPSYNFELLEKLGFQVVVVPSE